MTTTLDTRGRVAGNIEGLAVWYEFEDLDPFTQGYIEAALLATQWPDPSEGYGPSSSVIRFDWLAPEALAAILKDCARHPKDYLDGKHEAGRAYWQERQRSNPNIEWSGSVYAPLTVSLDDDGKVRLSTIERAEAGR